VVTDTLMRCCMLGPEDARAASRCRFRCGIERMAFLP